MIKKDYAQIKETLYTETLANGLKVYLLPKNDFQKTYGLFTTDYGSIDNTFVPIGQEEMIEVPDGIAHFLEHKMFEKEDGDVFQKIWATRGFSECLYQFYENELFVFNDGSSDTKSRNVA